MIWVSDMNMGQICTFASNSIQTVLEFSVALIPVATGNHQAIPAGHLLARATPNVYTRAHNEGKAFHDSYSHTTLERC